jgi:hypothetical protein
LLAANGYYARPAGKKLAVQQTDTPKSRNVFGKHISRMGPSIWKPEAPLMKHFLLLSLLAVASPVFPQDAMFRGNPEHTGVYKAGGVSKFSGVKWQFHTKGQILSSPAIAGDSLYFGSSDHYLYALDLAKGEQKWKFKTEGRVTSSPAISAVSSISAATTAISTPWTL